MATVEETLARAVHFHQTGNLGQAERLYELIRQVEPDHAEANHLMGVLAYQTGRLDLAMACICHALTQNPSAPLYHFNLGLVQSGARQHKAAIASYKNALRLRPDYAEAHNGLGNELRIEGRLAEAATHLALALLSRPDFPEAHYNLGITLFSQGKLDEALLHIDKALGMRPNCAPAHYDRAILWLLQGDFDNGWREYEWRLKQPDVGWRSFSQPRWDGSPLQGRTLLLHAEQGLGDTLQFIRYGSLVKQRDGTVVFECPRQLLPLLATCEGIDRLVPLGAPLPPFDVHAPLLSLPGILRTTMASLPREVPYLDASAELVDKWRRELMVLNGFKVGIAWQGNSTYNADCLRSIPLTCLARLAEVEYAYIISLQKGPGTEELSHLGGRLPVVDAGMHLDEGCGAFMDTAAVMKNLDLVVTSDTAIAHLAGALGVPVWLALPLVPEWRWLLEREDSPWYPTVRLFRQGRVGDWDSVAQAMVKELAIAVRRTYR